jgi:hypothetical protein
VKVGGLWFEVSQAKVVRPCVKTKLKGKGLEAWLSGRGVAIVSSIPIWVRGNRGTGALTEDGHCSQL